MPVAKAECTKPSFQLLAMKQNQMHVFYISVSHLHAGETSKANVLKVERAVTELNYGPSLMSPVVEKENSIKRPLCKRPTSTVFLFMRPYSHKSPIA